MGIFSKIKAGLKKTSEAFAYKLNKLFTGGVLNDSFYEQLEDALLTADVGSHATELILERLKDVIDQKHIKDPKQVKDELKQIIIDILDENEIPENSFPQIILISGVNGVGKTTTIGKLAHKFRNEGKSVVIAAADTFRAAAADQLSVWAERAKVRIIKHAEGANPSAVVYDAIMSAKNNKTDVLLIDTAGRLQNKKNLMDELKKITRVVEREMPEASYLNYIVLDATTGQNALSQIEVFDETVDLDGIVLTKLDGTARGGVVLKIASDFNIPVIYVGVGEKIDDLIDFDSRDFTEALLSEN